MEQEKTGRASIRQQKKTALTDDKVCQYLLDNPNFFVRYANQLDHLKIFSPTRGIISLTEWHITKQRKKIQQLEQKIESMLQNVAKNEFLLKQLTELQLGLFKINSLAELAVYLQQWARQCGLQDAYLYLFGDSNSVSTQLKYRQLFINEKRFSTIKIRYFNTGYHYLGQLNQVDTWLLPKKLYNHSLAISLLGQFGDLGVLIFVSHDSEHYQDGQGLLLLEKIRLLLSDFIGRWMTTT